MVHGPRVRRRAGFTILELVIVMSLMAMLVGAALPVTGAILRSKGRRATRVEMELLAEAATAFFTDTGQLPADPDELLADSGDAGWAGPYVLGAVEEVFGGQSGYAVDAWGNAYGFTRAGDVLTITSGGADGAIGAGDDDLERVLDVTPVRRALTQERLRVINNAIAHWNAVHLADDPLPVSYATTYARLVGAGLLPDDPDFRTDAWGADYVADPPASPVVRVTSPAFQ